MTLWRKAKAIIVRKGGDFFADIFKAKRAPGI
jgi:hypothetical protein